MSYVRPLVVFGTTSLAISQRLSMMAALSFALPREPAARLERTAHRPIVHRLSSSVYSPARDVAKREWQVGHAPHRPLSEKIKYYFIEK